MCARRYIKSSFTNTSRLAVVVVVAFTVYAGVLYNICVFPRKNVFLYSYSKNISVIATAAAMVKSSDTKTPGKTETEDDGPIRRFCKKCNINYNLIMLKVTLFLMYGGKYYNSYDRFTPG